MPLRTLVFCLEGCHGSGKTEICEGLRRLGFEVLDEAFLEQPEYGLHPQSLVMETYWVAHWFQRLLKRHHEIIKEFQASEEEEDDEIHYRVLIADRSPFSAVFYAKTDGGVLTDVIRRQIDEIREEASIYLFSVCVDVDPEILWERIQIRLGREPHRAKYNEGSREWMVKTLSFYNSFEWDFRIPNSRVALTDVVMNFMRHLTEQARDHGHELCRDPQWGSTMNLDDSAPGQISPAKG